MLAFLVFLLLLFAFIFGATIIIGAPIMAVKKTVEHLNGEMDKQLVHAVVLGIFVFAILGFIIYSTLPTIEVPK